MFLGGRVFRREDRIDTLVQFCEIAFRIVEDRGKARRARGADDRLQTDQLDVHALLRSKRRDLQQRALTGAQQQIDRAFHHGHPGHIGTLCAVMIQRVGHLQLQIDGGEGQAKRLVLTDAPAHLLAHLLDRIVQANGHGIQCPDHRRHILDGVERQLDPPHLLYVFCQQTHPGCLPGQEAVRTVLDIRTDVGIASGQQSARAVIVAVAQADRTVHASRLVVGKPRRFKAEFQQMDAAGTGHLFAGRVQPNQLSGCAALLALEAAASGLFQLSVRAGGHPNQRVCAGQINGSLADGNQRDARDRSEVLFVEAQADDLAGLEGIDPGFGEENPPCLILSLDRPVEHIVDGDCNVVTPLLQPHRGGRRTELQADLLLPHLAVRKGQRHSPFQIGRRSDLVALHGKAASDTLQISAGDRYIERRVGLDADRIELTKLRRG